ncbi:hypothetical protein Leryth_005871 [Lithospermum erythrorhizon]|nr:hypothetical protein Leryth_005871 [Lithospermum erythrorhizon]
MAAISSLSLLRGAVSVRALSKIRLANSYIPPRSLCCEECQQEEEGELLQNLGRPNYIGSHADFMLQLFVIQIIAKEIPSSIVYEDDRVLAFRDINPQAPVHVLIIPKQRDGLTELGKAEQRHEDILGHLLYASKLVAEKEGIADGFRVVINSGPTACQSVYHLHLHVLGGRQLKWPPG